MVCYVLLTGPAHIGLAHRFIETYQNHPPGYPHTLAVICNDRYPDDIIRNLFKSIPCIFLPGDNVGWDIGAYQAVAQTTSSDLMVCFGSSSYFKRGGWLERMVSIYSSYGDHLYGVTGCLAPTPHIRTTGFWCSPKLLADYPYDVKTYQDRYQFEHGYLSFTAFAISQKREAFVIYWNHMKPLLICDGVPNGYHNGDQSEVMAFDRCTELHCP